MTLKIGMLWRDSDPKLSLNMKLEKAIDYYEKKYGKKPNLCHVNPGVVVNGNGQLPAIEIRADRSIRPNHFWIGVGEE